MRLPGGTKVYLCSGDNCALYYTLEELAGNARQLVGTSRLTARCDNCNSELFYPVEDAVRNPPLPVQFYRKPNPNRSEP